MQESLYMSQYEHAVAALIDPKIKTLNYQYNNNKK